MIHLRHIYPETSRFSTCCSLVWDCQGDADGGDRSQSAIAGAIICPATGARLGDIFRKHVYALISDCWFGTFFSFVNGNNHPNWLVFSGVETTNHMFTYIYICMYCIYIYYNYCKYEQPERIVNYLNFTLKEGWRFFYFFEGAVLYYLSILFCVF